MWQRRECSILRKAFLVKLSLYHGLIRLNNWFLTLLQPLGGEIRVFIVSLRGGVGD